MFDDYDHKHTDTRISVRFVQKRDEPMYPWEIASFLKTLNTVYYKNELLNSICSAIKHGIPPTDIFIFNKSLPLYRRYTEMDLLEERQAAKYWYDIGLPYPLVPNVDVYEYNLLYQAFYRINSLLRSKKVRPLTTDSVASAYDVLKQSGLDIAEKHIVALALERAQKSAESAKKRKENKEPIGEHEITGALERYKKRKLELLEDVAYLHTQTEDACRELIISSGRIQKRRAVVLLSFFRYFDKTSRPLVCVRVEGGKFRVLGRSLVNKTEQTGLEVKEVRRNSPLGALIEGGIALGQAIQQEKRNKELHELELEKKKLELQQAATKLDTEKYLNLAARLEVANKLDKIAKESDIQAINSIPPSFARDKLLHAYAIEQRHAGTLLLRQGLELDSQSIQLVGASVDVKV